MKPSLKKPRDFTVAEGHGHPLVSIMSAASGFTLHIKTLRLFFSILVLNEKSFKTLLVPPSSSWTRGQRALFLVRSLLR
jgi:hypothetical protein